MTKIIFMRNISVLGLAFLFLFLITSCGEKCYECTRQCGSCTFAGFPAVAGCDGDSLLTGFSVESWKFYLEARGYDCTITTLEEKDICDNTDKESLEARNYKCVVQ